MSWPPSAGAWAWLRTATTDATVLECCTFACDGVLATSRSPSSGSTLVWMRLCPEIGRLRDGDCARLTYTEGAEPSAAAMTHRP